MHPVAHIDEPFPVVRVSEIAPEDAQTRWLIQGLWGAASVGFVAGHPKSCKSWAGLEIALSVATGTPCLGHFPVAERGRVLIYLAEDSLAMLHERVAALARHRGIDLAGVDLHVITTPELRLDLEEHRRRLEATVRSLRPRLLLLDPLVRLHRLDENRAGDVAGLLSHLRALQRTYEVAVILVHHTRKDEGGAGPAGQGLRGSGDLWAWFDSTLYLRKIKGRIRLTVEHRSAAAPDPIWLQLVDSDPERLHLELVTADIDEEERRCLAEAVVDTLRGDVALTRTELRGRLRVKNARLGPVLVELEQEGRAIRDSTGWRLPGSDNGSSGGQRSG